MVSELAWLFVTVTVCGVLVVFVATLPKFKLVGKTVTAGRVEFTVSVTGLLVVDRLLPSVITTRNSQPLAPAGTAGVVMLAEVPGVESQFDQVVPLVLNCH